MVGELDVLNEWIPEQMQPGTVFVLENAGEIGEKEDPYWAVLSCPSCGMLGLITRKQMRAALDGSDPAKRVGDLVERGQFPHVHADHPLDLALERMGAARVDVLPVVNRANVHDLLGVVRLRDVLVSYGLNDPCES